jgi:hypothetical protein
MEDALQTIDLEDDSIDMEDALYLVILDIDMGHLVTLNTG